MEGVVVPLVGLGGLLALQAATWAFHRLQPPPQPPRPPNPAPESLSQRVAASTLVEATATAGGVVSSPRGLTSVRRRHLPMDTPIPSSPSRGTPDPSPSPSPASASSRSTKTAGDDGGGVTPLRYGAISAGWTMLDTRGVLAQSWRSSMQSELGGTRGSGWVHLGIVLLATWIALNAWSDAAGFEKEVWSRCKWMVMRAFTVGKWSSAWFASVAAAYTCISYGLTQVFHRWLSLSITTEFAIMVVLEGCLFLTTAAAIHTFAADWPLIARLAFVMETAVLAMKCHSYAIANALLRRGRTYLFTLPFAASTATTTLRGGVADSLPAGTMPSGFATSARTTTAPADGGRAGDDGSNDDEGESTSPIITWAPLTGQPSPNAAAGYAARMRAGLPPQPPPPPKSAGGRMASTGPPTTATGKRATKHTSPLLAALHASPPATHASRDGDAAFASQAGLPPPPPLSSLPGQHAGVEWRVDSSRSGVDGSGAPLCPPSTPPVDATRYEPQWAAFLYFSLAPTLVFEPSYPRASRMRLPYLVEKVCIGACLYLAGGFVVYRYIQPAFAGLTAAAGVETGAFDFMAFMDTFLHLLMPTITVCIIMFFLVFECYLNGVAEVTRFGARNFYRDWWSSSTFLEFSRRWNRPVHEFLHRHLFVDLQALFGVRRTTSLYITFLISIIMHEVILWATLAPITPPPALSILSCSQFPLIQLMNHPAIKGKVLGNILFWVALEVGLSMMVTLYGRAYCTQVNCTA